MAMSFAAKPGTPEWYAEYEQAMKAYKSGTGANPITGKMLAEEGDSWMGMGTGGEMRNYMMANPDVAMNYIYSQNSGVTPEQAALTHFDQYGVTEGRGGVLSTGQTAFERGQGVEGGTLYNAFGNESGNNPALLDARQGIGLSQQAADRYKTLFGDAMQDVGPFGGLNTPQRNAIAAQLRAQAAAKSNPSIVSGLFSGSGQSVAPSYTSVDFNKPDPNYNPNTSSAGGSSTDYNTQLQDYYKAYFGDKSTPNMNVLNSWYSGSYSPAPTGFSMNAPGASSARSIVNSLGALFTTNPATAVQKLNEYRQIYGLSTKDIATAMNLTEDAVISLFGANGIKLQGSTPAPKSVTEVDVTDRFA